MEEDIHDCSDEEGVSKYRPLCEKTCFALSHAHCTFSSACAFAKSGQNVDIWPCQEMGWEVTCTLSEKAAHTWRLINTGFLLRIYTTETQFEFGLKPTIETFLTQCIACNKD